MFVKKFDFISLDDDDDIDEKMPMMIMTTAIMMIKWIMMISSPLT